jgi:hypothetical protein
VSDIPWWSLPLTAGVFALAGALIVQLVTARQYLTRRAAARRRRWYEERRAAYVALIAAFERSVARLRRDHRAGITEPDPLVYHDEVGPALIQVRLLATGEVRNAALAVHRLLEDLHGPRPATARSEDFDEVINHVPLVLHDVELAVRAELGIEVAPPPLPPEAPPSRRARVAALVRPKARPPRSEHPEPASGRS